MDRELIKQKLENGDYKKYTDEEITKILKIQQQENPRRQLYIVAEEMAELTQEVTKTLRGKRNEIGLQEEFADTFISLKILYLELQYNLASEIFDISAYTTDINLDKVYKVRFDHYNDYVLFRFLSNNIDTVNRAIINMTISDYNYLPVVFKNLITLCCTLDVDYETVREIINIKVSNFEMTIKNIK